MIEFLQRHTWIKHFDGQHVIPKWYIWAHWGQDGYYGVDFRAGLWELRFYWLREQPESA